MDSLVARWRLQPHPEGGWYREVQRSSIQVIRPDGQARSAITTVLFLLGAEDVSRWHYVHGGDEFVGQGCCGSLSRELKVLDRLETPQANSWGLLNTAGTDQTIQKEVVVMHRLITRTKSSGSE